MTLPGTAVKAVAALALVVAAIPATVRSYRPSSPQFSVRRAVRPSNDPPQFSGEFLPQQSGTSVHSATVAELPNGDLLAAWYGGSNEAASDVQIFSSRLDHTTKQWTAPAVLETRQSAEAALGFRVKSVGNPVLLADERGVSLFFVSIIFGGWSGGTICVKNSPDGLHWAPAKSIHTSPFLNVGMLVRAKPWRYTDGTIALPIYHELINKWSAIARVDASGRVIDLARIADSRPFIQPWIVPLDAARAVAFLRFSDRMPGCVNITRTDDSGVTWSAIAGTPLVHRDSGLAGMLLGDGSLLAAYNNTAWDRRDLSLARSTDSGIHWSKPHPLERDTSPDLSVRREYSYPFLFQSRDGLYHVLYTWQRTRIRHVVFNDSWITADPLLGRTGR